MNAKTLTTALLVALWGLGSAAAQSPTDTPTPGIESPPIKQVPSAPDSLPTPDVLPGAGPPPAVPTGLSDYILYRRPSCCSAGPLMPLYSEVYARVGPSIPVGGTFTGRNLLVGWTFEGG